MRRRALTIEEQFPEPSEKRVAEMKAKYPDATILWRVGNRYKVFGQADTEALFIALHGEHETDGLTFAEGSFHHTQLPSVLPNLIKGGHRVAICEFKEN